MWTLKGWCVYLKCDAPFCSAQRRPGGSIDSPLSHFHSVDALHKQAHKSSAVQKHSPYNIHISIVKHSTHLYFEYQRQWLCGRGWSVYQFRVCEGHVVFVDVCCSWSTLHTSAGLSDDLFIHNGAVKPPNCDGYQPPSPLQKTCEDSMNYKYPRLSHQHPVYGSVWLLWGYLIIFLKIKNGDTSARIWPIWVVKVDFEGYEAPNNQCFNQYSIHLD